VCKLQTALNWYMCVCMLVFLRVLQVAVLIAPCGQTKSWAHVKDLCEIVRLVCSWKIPEGQPGHIEVMVLLCIPVQVHPFMWPFTWASRPIKSQNTHMNTHTHTQAHKHTHKHTHTHTQTHHRCTIAYHAHTHIHIHTQHAFPGHQSLG